MVLIVIQNYGDRESCYSVVVILEVVGRGCCSSCGCGGGGFFVDDVYVGGFGQGWGIFVYCCDCKF